jgi:hypothetical protein
MSNTLIIEGREYVPATLAGKHFGYTKDYLLMLIKQDKIDGKKVGNKWYVHIPSADEHFKVARVEREERRREISRERKNELLQSLQTQKKNTHHVALAETLAILILGLAVGVVGYVGTSSQFASVNDRNTIDFFGNVALSLYTTVTPNVPDEIDVNSTREENPTSSGDVEAMIIAPADEFTEVDVASIQESFSDPVTVTIDQKNIDTGIVTPIFKDGKKGEEYRFLLVPLDTGSDESGAQDDSSNTESGMSNGNVPMTNQ